MCQMFSIYTTPNGFSLQKSPVIRKTRTGKISEITYRGPLVFQTFFQIFLCVHGKKSRRFEISWLEECF